MKQRSLLLFICILILAGNAQATITCGEPKLSKPTARGSIYHFKAVISCQLVDEDIKLNTLKDAYLSDITNKGSQFKVHKQQNYAQKGLTGYLLDVTQSYVSPHGAMAVRANVIIADDNSKQFYYDLRSKSISAQDDAKLDKFILNTTTLDFQPKQSVLTLTKEIDVEEPWYAPDSIFFGRIESELKDSIRKAAVTNAQKVCGKNVDALRK